MPDDSHTLPHKQKYLAIIANLRRELNDFEKSIQDDFLRTSIRGEPLFISALNNANRDIMLTLAGK